MLLQYDNRAQDTFAQYNLTYRYLQRFVVATLNRIVVREKKREREIKRLNYLEFRIIRGQRLTLILVTHGRLKCYASPP